MRKNLFIVSALCLAALMTVACNRNANAPEKSSNAAATPAQEQTGSNPHAGVSASPNKPGDPMTDSMMKVAGSGAADCGRVPAGGDNTSASECAMKAYNEKKPFYVRYDLPMPDAQMSIATVRTADGKMMTMQFDSNGWEKPQEGGTLSADKKIGTAPCPKPEQLRIAGSGRVTCYPPTQMPAGMSPHGGGMKMPPGGMPPAGTPNPHQAETQKAH